MPTTENRLILSVVPVRQIQNPFLITMASLFHINRWDNDQYLKVQNRPSKSDKKRNGNSLFAKDSKKRI